MPYLSQNKKFWTYLWDLHIKKKPLSNIYSEQPQTGSSELSRKLTKKVNNQIELEYLSPTNLPKKEVRMRWMQKKQASNFLFFKVSENIWNVANDLKVK